MEIKWIAAHVLLTGVGSRQHVEQQRIQIVPSFIHNHQRDVGDRRERSGAGNQGADVGAAAAAAREAQVQRHVRSGHLGTGGGGVAGGGGGERWRRCFTSVEGGPEVK